MSHIWARVRSMRRGETCGKLARENATTPAPETHLHDKSVRACVHACVLCVRDLRRRRRCRGVAALDVYLNVRIERRSLRRQSN